MEIPLGDQLEIAHKWNICIFNVNSQSLLQCYLSRVITSLTPIRDHSPYETTFGNHLTDGGRCLCGQPPTSHH